jgi:hypothetical protein
MIYKYVLLANEPFFLSFYQCEPLEQRSFGLALVCKQTYQEALPIFFGMNTFSFYSVEDMARCLKTLDKRQRDLIRSICFEYCGKTRNEGMNLLADCSNLQQLKINASEDTISGSKWRHDSTFDLCTSNGMKQLLKVRGCSEVVVEFRKKHRHWQHAPKASGESIRRFGALLKRELCQSREEDKKEQKAKAKGKDGKKDFAAA